MIPSGIRRRPNTLAGFDFLQPVHSNEAPDRMMPVTSPFSGMKWQESRSDVDVIGFLRGKSR
jgi:hypothetical protein